MAMARSLQFGISFGIDSKKLEFANKKVDDFKRDVIGAGNEVNQMGNKAKIAGNKTFNSMNQAQKSTKSFTSALKDNKYELLGLFTAATATIGAAVKQFTDFETSISEVFTLLPNASAKSMGKLTEDIKQFSLEMGITTNKSVPALYQALSAGVPPNNVISFLETAQKTAVGGKTDIETAVDGLSSIVNSYGKDIINATEASNIMFATMRSGKTTIGELSSNLYNVIPTASALGVKFQDVGAALATMTAQGTPTAQATTQIRQLMNELSREGGKAATTFENMAGKTFSEFISQGGNLGEAMQYMTQAARQNDTSVKNLFSSVEAGQGALGLTGKSLEKFNKNLDNMYNSSGLLETAFEKMDKTTRRSLERLASSIEGIAISFADSLAPVINTVSTGLSWLLNTFNKMPKPLKTIISFTGLLGTVLLGLVTAAAFVVPAFINFFALFKTGGALYAATTFVTGTAIPAITGFFSTIAAFATGTAIPAIISFAGTFGLPILAIGSLIAAGVALYKNWDLVSEKATSLKNKVVSGISGIVEWVKNNIGVSGLMSILFPPFSIGKIVTENLDAIKDRFSDLKNWALNLFDGKGFLGFLFPSFNLGQLISTQINSMPNWMQGAAKKMFSFIGGETNGISTNKENDTQAVNSTTQAISQRSSSNFNIPVNVNGSNISQEKLDELRRGIEATTKSVLGMEIDKSASAAGVY